VKRDEEEVLILTEVGESAWGNGLHLHAIEQAVRG
jgi:hypothetical protein